MRTDPKWLIYEVFIIYTWNDKMNAFRNNICSCEEIRAFKLNHWVPSPKKLCVYIHIVLNDHHYLWIFFRGRSLAFCILETSSLYFIPYQKALWISKFMIIICQNDWGHSDKHNLNNTSSSMCTYPSYFNIL